MKSVSLVSYSPHCLTALSDGWLFPKLNFKGKIEAEAEVARRRVIKSFILYSSFGFLVLIAARELTGDKVLIFSTLYLIVALVT